MFQSKRPGTFAWLICAAIFLITLFFGLKPKGFRFYNQVEWLQDKNAIAFQNIGMAYSKQTLGAINISNSLSIITSLKPYRTGYRLSKILSIIDRNGNELLVLQQWKKGLEIVLKDASGNRLGKIGIEDVLSTDSSRWVAVTVTSSEMKLFPEKSPQASRNKHIKLPSNFFAEGRLLLGLSASCRNSWQGEVAGLALFEREVDPRQLQAYVKAWNTGSMDSEFGGNTPAALFFFDDHRGNNISDRSGNNWDLHIPVYPRFFKYEVLRILPDSGKIDRSLVLDVVINFFGFFPLGICVYIMFLLFRFSRRNSILLAVIFSLITSLGIELVQALIPTRSSQLMDVFFNGIGAWVGIVLVRLIIRFISSQNN
jgi:VanZ family protein